MEVGISRANSAYAMLSHQDGRLRVMQEVASQIRKFVPGGEDWP